MITLPQGEKVVEGQCQCHTQKGREKVCIVVVVKVVRTALTNPPIRYAHPHVVCHSIASMSFYLPGWWWWWWWFGLMQGMYVFKQVYKYTYKNRVV